MNGPNSPAHPASDIDLSSLDDDFAEAPEDRSFQELPDGKYQVNVDAVELTTAKTSGRPMLKWTLKILGPRFAGRLMWRNHVITQGPNLAWLKQDLRLCGLELQKISELRANLHLLLDVKLEVSRKTVGENSNIYFNRRIANDEPVPGGHDGGHGYDEAPF